MDRDWVRRRGVGGDVGIEDPFHFSRLFKRTIGVSPREYRRTIKG
jgi:AraC-like DNA-binding protein